MHPERGLAGATPIYYRRAGRPCRSSMKELWQSWHGSQGRGNYEVPSTDGTWLAVAAVERVGSRRTRSIHLRDGMTIHSLGGQSFLSGERFVSVNDLGVGHVLGSTLLPDEPGCWLAKPSLGWVVGFYLAEGEARRGAENLRFALHQEERDFLCRLSEHGERFGGSLSVSNAKDSKACHATLTGKAAVATVLQYVAGSYASGKHLSRRAWSESRCFLGAVMRGLLDGDGHWDEANRRWRMRLTWNKELCEDLLTIGSRIGWRVRFRRRWGTNQSTRRFLCAEVEVREGGYRGRTENTEVVRIASAQDVVFDLRTEGDDRLALPNGVLTGVATE